MGPQDDGELSAKIHDNSQTKKKLNECRVAFHCGKKFMYVCLGESCMMLMNNPSGQKSIGLKWNTLYPVKRPFQQSEESFIRKTNYHDLHHIEAKNQVKN